MTDQLPHEDRTNPPSTPSHTFAQSAKQEVDPNAGATPRQEPSPKSTRETEVADREERRLKLKRLQEEVRAESQRARDYEIEANRKELEVEVLRAQLRSAQAEAGKREKEMEVMAGEARITNAEADRKEAEAEIPLAQAHNLEAEATKKEQEAKMKEQEAKILEAQALKAHHAATKEPGHQTVAIAGGWTRIGLTVLLTVATIVFAYVGYVADPVAFVPAALSGGGLAWFAPWRFLLAPMGEPKEPAPGGDPETSA